MALSVNVASPPVENVVEKALSSPTKPIDYHLLLSSFLKKHDAKLLPQLNKMLRSYAGKETKLCLRLAKKYDALNPLNRVFVSRVVDEDYNDYEKLTTLYLSIFYPQDVDEARALCTKYVGNENELFKKLSSNFRAINPLLMDRGGVMMRDDAAVVDYKALLIAFYETHDPDQVASVEETLGKCVGKEAILFSVIALKYDTSNALNAVFEERIASVVEQTTTVLDYLCLLKLYLSVFHPSCVTDAKTMLDQYQGKESELFSRLATKFRACNPLDVCGDSIGSGSTLAAAPATVDGCDDINSETPRHTLTPTKKPTKKQVAQSPAVTP
jgi:hypothetical protein